MNLRSLVTQVLKSSVLADPEDIAAEVMRRIQPGSERDALAQALPTFVRTTISSQRSSLGSTPTPPIPGQGVAFHQRGVSVREGWQRALRDREMDPHDGWIFLGDATVENLERMAARRDQQAAANHTKARRLRALAAALVEHDVERVKDLPADALMPLLGAKAA